MSEGECHSAPKASVVARNPHANRNAALKVDYFKAAYLARPENKNVGTAPLAYDGARGRTGQRRARRARSGCAHRIDCIPVDALKLAARPAPAGTSSNSSGPPRLRASVTR